MKVGIYDKFFRPEPSMTHGRKPVAWEYVDNCDDPERVKVVMGTYANLRDVAASKHPRRVYYLQETTEVRGPVMEAVYPSLELILTNDESVLRRHVNARYMTLFGTWIKGPALKDKTKGVSFIASANAWTSGHRLRWEVARSVNGYDGFGDLFDRHVETKEESLEDYHFQIVIENSRYNWWHTEKLFDCFAMKTVPIYWGPEDTSKLEEWGFDPNGILPWSGDMRDLQLMVLMLKDDPYPLYRKLRDAVLHNYIRVQELSTQEDALAKVIEERFNI